MIQNDFKITVNMPNCSNIIFHFENNEIINSKRKSFIDSKDAVVFYSLSTEIQYKISKFLNPYAIFH